MKAGKIPSLALALALAGCSADGVAVLVARKDVPAGERFNHLSYRIERLPRRLAAAAWVREQEAGLLIGRELKMPLCEGMPISRAVLRDRELPERVSPRLVPGARAATVWVQGGEMVLAGDFVDVLVSLRDPHKQDMVTTTLLQDVRAVGVGPARVRGVGSDGGAPDRPGIRPMDAPGRRATVAIQPFVPTGEMAAERPVSLMLLPQEAGILVLASHLGTVHVSLRHPDDRSLIREREAITIESLIAPEPERSEVDEQVVYPP
ncbi:MAG: Flp pilus assembly protein CpaB [Deltaproteobacteria bacterium]|nr:Flp pilus assembly protein CpaB [Deltaproteobacteria bacterium]